MNSKNLNKWKELNQILEDNKNCNKKIFNGIFVVFFISIPFLIIKYTHHLQNHILFADCGIGRLSIVTGKQKYQIGRAHV